MLKWWYLRYIGLNRKKINFIHVAVKPIKKTHVTHILLLLGSTLEGHLEGRTQEKLNTGLWTRSGLLARPRTLYISCLLLSRGSLVSRAEEAVGSTETGEGNGTPLRCSCPENPRDEGAWWAASMRPRRVGHDWSDSAAAALKQDGLGFSRLRVWLRPQLRPHVKQPRAQRAGCTPTTCHAFWP